MLVSRPADTGFKPGDLNHRTSMILIIQNLAVYQI